MKKLNIDNWFFRTMALIGDWVMLSVLWVIGCLPVVTAGAATLSVFAVAHKMAAGQDYAVCRDFCKAFRRDFRQATVLWLPMLALALLLVLDGWYGGRIPAPWGGLLRGAAVAATLVWVLSFSWGLALLARFTYRKSADALKNGLVLALRTPRGSAADPAACGSALGGFNRRTRALFLPAAVLAVRFARCVRVVYCPRHAPRRDRT